MKRKPDDEERRVRDLEAKNRDRRARWAAKYYACHASEPNRWPWKHLRPGVESHGTG